MMKRRWYITDIGTKNLRVISGIVLGVEDNEPIEFNLKLYPNPAKDMLYIDGTKFSNSQYKLRIIDALGKQVFTKDGYQIDGKVLEKIDVAKLSSGVYFVEILSGKITVTKSLSSDLMNADL